MKKVFILSSIFGLGLLMASPSYASYANNCQPIYGGGENCTTVGQILLDKKVQDPKSKEYVDNLSRNTARYTYGQKVNFRLIVTNTGDTRLDEVTVTDTLPQYINFVAGPGFYTNDSRVLNFKVSNLNPKESRTYTIVGKVADYTELPKDMGIKCVVNQAEAVSDNNVSDDNSQVCIEIVAPKTKGGLPVMDAPDDMTSTPATGPEMIPLLGLIPAAGVGLFLRKFKVKS